MIIGSKIKEKRIALGLSQDELGKRLGVSKVSICGYEKGTRTPTIQNIDGVSDKDNEYVAHLSKTDLQIIKELKKHGRLYNKVVADPVRTIELFDRLSK